ncbi:asparaginase [Jeotgalibaca caeni]|uniref:asparaginase n=1 Tax=Jeotgalibaca caeni TaxID=3028623 RepID=UPI00237D3F34|nr:asparaginase [Jeotgalibaca caeni]MDE1549910.1 asparaginase [Jeotgalibaca caeni]
MKKIAILSTGGTIAMQADESGLANSALGPKKLLELANVDRDNMTFIEIEYKNIPSPHLQIRDIVELKELIEKAVKEEQVDGVVITHGTDTLQETAYFLDMTLQANVPIVITGAQRNSSLPMSDAALNIIDSIIVASDSRAAEMGVVVVFGSEIIPARDVIKTHKTAVTSFKAIEFGHIGHVSNNRAVWARKPLIRDYYPIGENIAELRVEIIPAYLGQDSNAIRHAIENGADGLVVEGLGAGHAPLNMIPGIEEAVKRGIPIVWGSRSRNGRMLTDTYGFIGSETYLRKMGVIWGEDLTPDKLRLKLLLLLSNGYDLEKMKQEFEFHFYS